MVQQEAAVHETSAGVLAGIGDTPLVELPRLVPRTGARVLMTLEWANPHRQYERPDGEGSYRGGGIRQSPDQRRNRRRTHTAE
jgi:hypothetical protein